MSSYEIPLRSAFDSFGITLASVSYRLTLVWRLTTWFLDIADVAGNKIVSGIPLITGADLLAQHPEAGIGGALYVVTDHDTDAQPTYANLGTGSHLYFVVSP